MEQQIIREKEIVKITGLSRTSIWRKQRDGSFPKRVRLGSGRAVGWLRSSVESWLQGLKEPTPAGDLEARREAS
ncbi:MAG: AlpA family phage regulatory protein [Deltaproteobacteria bacterium]|nr:AlpA family phage regulatory protein [Deltaproteobacteria bacterium]